jgi:hypothetical protein
MSKPEHSKSSPAGERAPDEVRAIVEDDDPADQPEPGKQRAPFPPPNPRPTGAASKSRPEQLARPYTRPDETVQLWP